VRARLELPPGQDARQVWAAAIRWRQSVGVPAARRPVWVARHPRWIPEPVLPAPTSREALPGDCSAAHLPDALALPANPLAGAPEAQAAGALRAVSRRAGLPARPPAAAGQHWARTRRVAEEETVWAEQASRSCSFSRRRGAPRDWRPGSPRGAEPLPTAAPRGCGPRGPVGRREAQVPAERLHWQSPPSHAAHPKSSNHGPSRQRGLRSPPGCRTAAGAACGRSCPA